MSMGEEILYNSCGEMDMVETIQAMVEASVTGICHPHTISVTRCNLNGRGQTRDISIIRRFSMQINH